MPLSNPYLTKTYPKLANLHPNKSSTRSSPLSTAQIIIVMIGNINSPSAVIKPAPILKLSVIVRNPNVSNCIANVLLKVAFYFILGSFCQNCNCECCQNTQEFSEIRAKAIDEMIMRSSINFGQKGSSTKGCNCRKTGCVKKYCECFNVGEKCSEYCKCSNCSNT